MKNTSQDLQNDDANIMIIDNQKTEKELSEILNDSSTDYTNPIVKASLAGVAWIGGFTAIGTLGLIASMLHDVKTKKEGEGLHSKLQTAWLEIHRDKLIKLESDIKYILFRLKELADSSEAKEELLKRMQSQEYLQLVRQSFKEWDNSETDEKREKFKKIIINSTSVSLCSDDVVRLFIQLTSKFHEAHFKILAILHENGPMTRYEIWREFMSHLDEDVIQGIKEDSPEIGMITKIFTELNLDGIIETQKEKGYDGRAYRAKPVKRVDNTFVQSKIDNKKNWTLTQLGKQYVFYVLDEPSKRIEKG